MSRIARALSATVACAGLLAVAAPAIACQVCFGDPNAPLTKGAAMGVWVLLGVILLVEAAFAVFFFVYLRRRVRNVRDPMPRPALRLIKKGA